MINHKTGMLLLALTLSVLAVFAHAKPLNNPYSLKDAHANSVYASFTGRPRTLDPASAYSSNEYVFIAQIYEPPLQYHYLKRPYTLIPLTATGLPTVKYFDANDHQLPDNAALNKIAYSLYEIHIKPGIHYQPHPAFAKDDFGNPLYFILNEMLLDDMGIHRLSDFTHQGTRELTADDYVYQIKRLAHPDTHSPILGLMSEYIVGLKEYSDELGKVHKALQSKNAVSYLDLRKYPLKGVNVTGPYSYQIKIKGKYPQFIYWLAMPFFAPIPWEVDYFYSQEGMSDKNLSFAWYPVGTGPYLLSENNPNRIMVLKKNPNFHGETFPSEGEGSDKENGLLKDAGVALPMVDKAEFYLEKESIPRWNKFLQGYYDTSGIASDSFDQAISIDREGQPQLTAQMKAKGIQLQKSVAPSIFYFGFNMLDPIVGGYTKKAKKLRHAIAIALDYEEFISIFANGRGIPAQGPIPPGIYGYRSGEAGIDNLIYDWVNNRLKHKPIAVAKSLLTEAGYPEGRDAKTGKPLVLNYDVPTSSGPDDKARFDWMRKQFDKLGIQLHIRATQYNHFQQKMRNGNAQMFTWGWNADYPDPENFLFLLYGPNSKVKHGGENAANYDNPEFNQLFITMKSTPNSDKRQLIIDKMLKILRTDSPWVWGYHPVNFVLTHQWNRVSKPIEIANNTLKYARLNPNMRENKRLQWNKPILWPVILLFIIIVLSLLPVWIRYHLKQKRNSC